MTQPTIPTMEDIRKLRESKGLSQKEMAALNGLHFEAYMRRETGISKTVTDEEKLQFWQTLQDQPERTGTRSTLQIKQPVETLGDYVKNCIAEKGHKSLLGFATASGLSIATLNRLVIPGFKPRKQTLRNLARKLDMDEESFVHTCLSFMK